VTVFTRRSLALLLLVFACSGTLPGTSRLDLQKARGQIDSLNAKLVGWLAVDQVDSATNLYTADAVLMAPDAPPASGRANIRALWAGMVATHHPQFVFQTLTLLGGDSVLVEHGRYALHMTPKAGVDSTTQPMDDHGSYIVVWIHRAERWQIKFDIAASDRASKSAPAP
jgi:ketosteroid isomerase-like protein